jgi:flavin reductase (DIM6/NTAB) family NADH-FMN oxidoreductase RutF
MGIVNRRNAVVGWVTLKVGKRVAKKKAAEAVPSARTGGVAAGALAAIECELEEIYPGGDHDLFVGRVISIRMGDTRKGPLVYHEGGYTSPKPVRRPGEAGAFVDSVRGFDIRLQNPRDRKRRW